MSTNCAPSTPTGTKTVSRHRTELLGLPTADGNDANGRGGVLFEIYASQQVSDAVRDIAASVSLYEAARITQIVEAAYLQGVRDGVRQTFEVVHTEMAKSKKAIERKLSRRRTKTRR